MANIKRRSKKSARRKPAYSGRSSKSSLVKLIKSVSLKQQETKMATYDTGVLNCLHNISQAARNNLFQTGQGITDGLTINNRLGDTVTPIGVKLYMTFRQPADRPNTNWKVWIVKTWGNVTPATFVPVKAITGNLMMDPLDTEKCSPVLIRTFKAPDNYYSSSLATSKETCFFKKIWIPVARTPYVYGQDGGTLGKKFQMTMYVAAYDTLGTLITDSIGSFACSQVFYFKDA